jgi:MFS family permease
MRGWVMSLWAVAWLGSTPVGGPIVGWIGQELGARWSLIAGGLPTIAVGLVTYPILVRVDRRRAAARAGAGDPAADEPVAEPAAP